MVTIDASVWVSAAIPSEINHQSSGLFLKQVIQEKIRIIVPSIVLPEVAGALARRLNNMSNAIQYANSIAKFSNLTLVDCDYGIAQMASRIAAEHLLRGADAVYAAVSQKFGCSLITLDQEQLNRLPPFLRTLTPSTLP